MASAPQTDLARLEQAPQDIARWQRARQQLQSGRPALALPAYQELVKRFPGVVNLWFELGAAAAADLHFPLATHAFDRVEQMASHDPSLLLMLAQQFHRLRRPDRARACFQRAAQADPSSTHASLSWAAWLERERRLDDAWAETESCLARQPRDPAALYYRSFLLQRLGRPAEAEAALRDLLHAGLQRPDLHLSALHLLAVVLDELGQYSEAMDFLLQAKAAARRQPNVAALEQSYDQSDRRRRALLASLTPAMLLRWRQEPRPAAAPPSPALLAGHPRSGTTLLEQILDAHPSLHAFDESEAFVSEVADKLTPPPPDPPLKAAALDSLSSHRRSELAARYWKSLLRETAGQPPADVLLDKNPSATASLPLWLRLFPTSKLIIALRDPRDVVLSCFFQNLALTPLNVNFLSLERTVKHYGDVMDVWLRLRDLGGFDWLETRYEDLVADVQKEGRRVTAFLGLDWRDTQARPHEAARRHLIFSPTYSDVAKPLHHRAIGRWKHYAAAFSPWQEKLARHAAALGYAPEGTSASPSTNLPPA